MKRIICFAATCALASTMVAQHSTSAGLDRNNMNLKVKPGTDFYQYAAGGWMKANPLTAEYSRYSQFEALTESNREKIKGIIVGYAEKDNAKGSIEQKIGSLYKLAMDSTRRNAEGFKPVLNCYKAVEDINDLTDYTLQLAQLKRMGVSAFMGIYAMADMKNSEWNLLHIGQGGMGLSDRDLYFAEDEHSQAIMEAYTKYIHRLFILAGHTEAEAKAKTEAVIRIEKRIAQQAYDATKRRDVAANYHKMSYADLLRNYPGVDWSTLLMVMGYPSVNEVCVRQPEPVLEVGKILTEEPLGDLKAYLAHKLIADAAQTLSDDFVDARFDFYGRVLSGQQEQQPRWKQAISWVESVLGMAVGKLYVDKYFPESSKLRMQRMITNLQEALSERIQQQSWMRDATKQQAQEKLAAFRVKVGYPNKWESYDQLVIDEQLSFYENMASASEYLLQEEIRKYVNKKVDRDEWLMTPQTINAYYNPTTNEICFPAGILQPPFFNAEADDAVNYGAIGVVIGHEMTHGFDDQGAQFDKNGNHNNWWTAEDKKNFAERQQVLVDYFSKLEDLPGINVNGRLTLGENTADHGGLKISLNALERALQSQPTGLIDGFTPQQRFFLSYALIWAQNIRDERLRQLNKVDPHTSAKWRVNGALPHIDAWYEAFGISKRAKLYLPKAGRADVW